METIIGISQINYYKLLYEQADMQLTLYKKCCEHHERKIKKLEEENKYYKILLKDKLDKELLGDDQ